MLYFNLSTLLVIFVIFLMQGMKSNSAVNPMVVQPPGVSLHAAPSFSYNIPQSGAFDLVFKAYAKIPFVLA